MSDKDKKVYISHTCNNKKCQKAFIDIDFCHDDDYAPEWKCCPECKKKGFKDDIEARDKRLFYNDFNKSKKQYFVNREFDEKSQQIFDNIMEKRRRAGEKIHLNSIMKETLEIRSYYNDDETVRKIR